MTAGPFPLGPRGDFELLELLGSGAAGAVYRARELSSKRQVALKVLLGPDARSRIRFSREGEIVASLVHPAIMRVHASGVLEGHPYLSCELIPGSRTLGDLWTRLSLEQRVGLVAQAARGLGYAHRQGIVHRDVKPANLLVDPGGKLKVADFGLATMEGLERLTRSGAVVGTAVYMAPEVVAGERDKVGPPTDVWSLGVVLYQLASDGELPFEAESWAQLGSMILSAPHRPLRDVAPRVPRALQRIVERALSKDPAQRYPNGDALAADLEEFLAGGGPQTAPRPRRRWGGVLVGFGVGSALVLALWPLVAPPQPADDSSSPVASPSASLSPTPALQPDSGEALGKLPLFTLRHAEIRGLVATAFTGPQALLSWGQDGCLREWDLRTQKLVGGAPHAGPRQGFLPLLEVLPSGDPVVAHGNRLLWLGDPAASTEYMKPEATALSSDGGRLAVAAGVTMEVAVYRVSSRELVTQIGRGPTPVHGLCFDPSGRFLVASRGDSGIGSRDEQVLELYEISTGELRWRQPTAGLARALACDEQGRLWIGTSTGHVEARSLEDGKVAQVLDSVTMDEREFMRAPTLPGAVSDLVILDGRLYAASGARADPSVGELTVWDLSTGHVLEHRTGRAWQDASLAISPDGRLLAVGTDPGRVEVWEIRGSP